ncbi:MAG: bifunctional 5,10-methylenetetrahydrofolate dehydrogenase/5,10-methenyltetrahydrofolate cyclohydrolase [Candidatus Eisenbacteria sp.]|nr:bifunctional 5,10-methylenetetrahydrofolate dehydrogenase/5,10-methenyltetrahydrofolate cyclohydrolase [Candidatus Eisenbacteria bacterium]
MAAEVLDGRAVAEKVKEELRGRIAHLGTRGLIPSLTLIRVGEDPASRVYVRAKQKACKAVGITSATIHLPEQSTRQELLDQVDALNRDKSVHGLLVQLPLPRHLAEDEILSAIDPQKDVDGFHPLNIGLLCLGTPRFIPATPLGILKILEFYQIPTEGRCVVVLGRSRTVGRPLANLLSAKASFGNATVTVCHTLTRDLNRHTREADIVIAAAGSKRFLTADMVSPDAVVIDVGIHREPDPDRPGKTRLCGDADFEGLKGRVRALTPVPGGVGPMTVASLLANTVTAAERLSPEGTSAL